MMSQCKTELGEEYERSIEIKNLGGARKSKLPPELSSFPFKAYDNVGTAWDVLERSCRLYGNNRCFGWKTSDHTYEWISYNEFKERARHFGCGLVNIGMTPGQDSSIGIYGDNSLEWLVTAYGCFSQSAKLIPVSDFYGPEFKIKMITQTKPEFIICDSESRARDILQKSSETPSLKHVIITHSLTEDLKQLALIKGIQLHLFQDVEELGRQKVVPILLPTASDVYMICFTSGSTGDPKAAVQPHSLYVSAACASLIQFEKEGVILSENDVMISHLLVIHTFENVCKMLMFLVGGSIGFSTRSKMEEDIQIIQPTFFPTVPRLLNKLYYQAHELVHSKTESIVGELCHESTDHMSSLKNEMMSPELYKQVKSMLGGKVRVILTAAARLSEKIINFYISGLDFQVIDQYGQTEFGAIYVNVFNKKTIGKGGVPLPGVIIKLVDVPDMEYFAKNNEGEICLKGHPVFKSYLNNPQKTREAFDSDGWLHTGDIGKFLPDGSLKIIDRLSNIFKISNGAFISPEKIEAIYSESKYVDQVLVYGNSMEDYLVSIVVPNEKNALIWLKEEMKCETTWSDACNNYMLKNLILSDMCRLGEEAGLLSFEQAKALHLHPDPLTFLSGHLTPTLKMKRFAWIKFFKPEIVALYKNTER